ncbi:MAG TPA: hypothetical protein VH186_11065 [Chloroflexia bacterium]|nr:hypothetical protein [Chloroflexia bacterium]
MTATTKSHKIVLASNLYIENTKLIFRDETFALSSIKEAYVYAPFKVTDSGSFFGPAGKALDFMLEAIKWIFILLFGFLLALDGNSQVHGLGGTGENAEEETGKQGRLVIITGSRHVDLVSSNDTRRLKRLARIVNSAIAKVSS